MRILLKRKRPLNISSLLLSVVKHRNPKMFILAIETLELGTFFLAYGKLISKITITELI